MLNEQLVLLLLEKKQVVILFVRVRSLEYVTVKIVSVNVAKDK